MHYGLIGNRTGLHVGIGFRESLGILGRFVGVFEGVPRLAGGLHVGAGWANLSAASLLHHSLVYKAPIAFHTVRDSMVIKSGPCACLSAHAFHRMSAN